MSRRKNDACRVANKKEGEQIALCGSVFSRHSSGCLEGLEAGRFGRVHERLAGLFDGLHTFHSTLNARNRPAAGIVNDRPPLLEPVLRLFDCADFSFFSALGDNERQGLTPIYFYHPYEMVTQ